MSPHMMPRSRPWSLVAISGLMLSGLVACESTHMLAPSASSTSATSTVRATVNCAVSFTPAHALSAFTCAQAGQTRAVNMLTAARVRARLARGSKASAVIIGGQGVDVNLAFSDFVDIGGIFSFDATVQNLLTQPLGTDDGATPSDTGTRVVVTSAPTTTSGTGTVTVAVDSGTMDVTAPGQPFWQYDAIIFSDSTSPPSNWKFNLPPTVTGFTFQVEVVASVPAELSVLRWITLRQGLTDSTLFGVWLNTPTNIYAVGAGGSVLNYNGSTWSTVAAGFAPGQTLYSVFGTGPSDVWTVGAAFSAHFNGASWTPVSVPAGTYYGVWEASPTNAYAVGTSILQNPGTGWATETNPTANTLRSVWGADSADVWAVGDGGTILFNPGTGTWTAQASCTTNQLRSVWGTSATNVYAVGAAGSACHFDGTGWSAVTVGVSPTTYLEAVGGSSATDVWVVSPTGLTSHFNGTAWSQTQNPVGTTLLGVTSGSASSVAIVGNHGTLLNFNGSSFVLSNQSGLPVYGIYATDSNNIYASSAGTILHWNGSTWSSAYAGSGDHFNAISGSGPSDIYAVGSAGNMTHFDGTTWTKFFVGGNYTGVYEASTNTIYAVGDTARIMKGSAPNAGSFAAVSSPGTANMTAVWANDPGDIFVVDSAGNIFQSTGGAFATTSGGATGVKLYSIHGLNGVDQWAVGAGGAAYQFVGPGPTWTLHTTTTTNTLFGVWEAAEFDLYAVGNGGTIQHWNGSAWSAMSSPVVTQLTCVHGTAQAHIYVGGGNGVVLFGTR